MAKKELIEEDTNERQRCCNNENTNNCCNSQNVALEATITPNMYNNGRTGTFRGQYRRRI